MAPDFETLVQDISSFVSKNTTVATKVDMHAYNGDWDVMYPFSAVRLSTSLHFNHYF